MKRVALLLVAMMLVVASCGGDAKGKDAKLASTDKTTSTTGPDDGGSKLGGLAPDAKDKDKGPTTTVKGGSSSSPTTAKPGPGGSTGTTRTTRVPFPVKMTLEKKCVRKGLAGDMQTLDVTTRPEDTIGYDTEYSDKSNGWNQAYKSGGTGYGKADGSGKFHLEWKVPDAAPEGPAILRVIADGRVQPELKFKVVGPTGIC